jgi:hypothetical protein
VALLVRHRGIGWRKILTKKWQCHHPTIDRIQMTDHIIINKITHVYECENCGYISEPPWMTPPVDVSVEAIDSFISEHKDCKKTDATSLK